MDTGGLRYVFGPVLSGRLGRSLGLDLLGRRICSMNCVYCESGRLETLTLDRAPYVPARDLLLELEFWERARAERGEPLPDAATLGGLGEPTLNSDMPEIIAGVRRILPGVPVAVLTNASLMTDPRVREELALADMILPSLDSLDAGEFRAVNRAHPRLDAAAIAGGLLEFRKNCRTKIFLEILLVAGINDTERNLALEAEYCARLAPDRVDVTTLSRPGTEDFARPAAAETLARWRARLRPLARSGPGLAGVAEKVQKGGAEYRPEVLEESVLASLARRPQTAAQLAAALLAPEEQIRGALGRLSARGVLVVDSGEESYYRTRRK